MQKLRLAGHLGKTLREIDRMDATEFATWQAFWAIDPPGDQRMDARFAMLAQVVAALVMEHPPKMSGFMLFPEGGSEPKGPVSASSLSDVMAQTAVWMSNGNQGR